jgi:hypothetical protein
VNRRVLAVAIALLVAACGGSPAPSPSGPTDSPLPAGTYTSTLFQPAVTFTVPDGWVLDTDTAGYLQLRPAGQSILGVHLFRGVTAASQDVQCPTEAQAGIGTTSSELVAWMRSLKGLVVTSPAMATIGGLRGVSVDIGIAPTWTQSCPFANGLPAVPLLVEPGTGLRWVLAGGERLRMYLLDLPDGGTLIIDIDDFDGSQFGTFVGVVAPIVKSFQFAGS